jgi:antitoxin (DNA-binding transcriptional repressor) of toxin-antitoxin stability system
MIQGMEPWHVTEADVLRDLADILKRVQSGAEVVIERDAQPLAVIRAAAPARRSISESIALAEARSRKLGFKPAMDANFAADMEDIIRRRKPRQTSTWD